MTTEGFFFHGDVDLATLASSPWNGWGRDDDEECLGVSLNKWR